MKRNNYQDSGYRGKPGHRHASQGKNVPVECIVWCMGLTVSNVIGMYHVRDISKTSGALASPKRCSNNLVYQPSHTADGRLLVRTSHYSCVEIDDEDLQTKRLK